MWDSWGPACHSHPGWGVAAPENRRSQHDGPGRAGGTHWGLMARTGVTLGACDLLMDTPGQGE